MVPRWHEQLSAPPIGSPAIVDERIVVSLQSGVVEARQIADGKVIWQSKVAIEWPASADAERVYVPSSDAIQALDLATGRTLWQVTTGVLTAPPLVHSGWVVAAAAGNLWAFRATDGSTVWQRNVGTIEFRPTVDGDSLFVPLLEGPLLCLNLQTGEQIWRRHLGGSPGEPMAVGGRVYVGAADKIFYVLDTDDGEERWRSRVGAAPRGRAAVDEKNIYFVALDNTLRAHDRGNGAIRWRSGLKYRPAEGPLLIRGGIVVPGAVPTLAVFGPGGQGLTDITFPSTVVGFSTASDVKAGVLLSTITGDLEHPWTLWLLQPSTDPPALRIVDLTALPGVTVEILLPQ